MNSIRKVAELLDCSKSSLQRWIEKYFEIKSVDRKENKPRTSIITKEILLFIKNLIKINPTITLSKIRKKVYKEHHIIISISYLFYIIKYKLNITHKQIRQKYYPEKN